MTLSKNTPALVKESIRKIELTADEVNFQLDVHYVQDKCSVGCETYLYDRGKKRYYRLVPDFINSGRRVKSRISEDCFHSVFSLYLKRRNVK